MIRSARKRFHRQTLSRPCSETHEVVKKLRLSPAEYENSVQLKDWVRKNKDQKYVPSDLLKAWDLEVQGDS